MLLPPGVPMPPPGMMGAGGPPGLPMSPPGAGTGGPPPGIAALLSGLGRGALPQPPGAPGGNPMDKIMPFLAGSGFQNILGTITKFLKIMSTTGERADKSVRVPMQGNAGPMDQMAAQQMMARQAMPGPGAMPPSGPANLPMRIGPM